MKKLRVTIEGKTYDVLVEIIDEGTSPAAPVSPLATAGVAPGVAMPAAPAPGPEPKPRANAGVKGPDDVVSPLAGKVVSIDVKVGQAVDEGTQVATLEAMKMNTYIYAPKGGRVAAVLVNPGDGVEEDSVLLKLN